MIIDNLIKKILKEATTEKTSRGSYVAPLLPGYREFPKNQIAPFTEFVTQWDDAMLDHDSMDGKMSTKKKIIKKREKRAEKISNYIKNNPDSFAWADDAGVMNGLPGKNTDAKPIKNFNPKKTIIKLGEWIEIADNTINEADTATTAGEYSGPQELGMKIWKSSELGPFTDESDIDLNKELKKRTTKKNIRKKIGVWEKNKNGSYEVPTYPVNSIKEKPINEDLAVWFGKKKKPKGSSQPKGPWVDICRKVDGKHPPCGRSDASEGSYPKCRAAGVAGKMSDFEKRSACQQKRKAEKNDPQSGKGQKPVMVSHKKKTNESMKNNIITLTESDIRRIVKRILKEEKEEPIISPNQEITLECTSYKLVGTSPNEEIQIGGTETISGILDTETRVLSGGSFQDRGHKIGEPWGSGFKYTETDKYGLVFNVNQKKTTYIPPGAGSGFPDMYDTPSYKFTLMPIDEITSSVLNIGQNDKKHIIFETSTIGRNSFCKIISNKPNEEFLTELKTNWDLNNDI